MWNPSRFEGKVFSGGVELNLSDAVESSDAEDFSDTEKCSDAESGEENKDLLQHSTEQAKEADSEATPVSIQEDKALESDSTSIPSVFELSIRQRKHGYGN